MRPRLNKSLQQWSRVLFGLGRVSLLAGLLLPLDAYMHPVRSPDYLEQACEGIPWVRWGLLTPTLACFLCAFGTGWARAGTVLLAFALLSLWYLIGLSLF